MKRQNSIPATLKEITGLQAVRQSGRGQSRYVLKSPPEDEYVYVCGNFEYINRYVEMLKTSGILDVYRLEGTWDGKRPKVGYLFVVLSKTNDVIGSFMFTEPGFSTFHGALSFPSKYHDNDKLEVILNELREENTVTKL